MSETTEKISRVVCGYFGITMEEMFDISDRRFKASDARAFTWYFLRRQHKVSPSVIAGEFGVSKRAVMLAIHNLGDRISLMRSFAEKYRELTNLLKEQ